MHSNIRPPVNQGLLEFLYEQSFAADFCKRRFEPPVAFSSHAKQGNVQSRLALLQH